MQPLHHGTDSVEVTGFEPGLRGQEGLPLGLRHRPGESPIAEFAHRHLRRKSMLTGEGGAGTTAPDRIVKVTLLLPDQ